VADVQADVPDAVEEDEIAGLERCPGDSAPQVELRERVVRERDAEMCVDVAGEARAVEAAAWAHATVDIRDPEETPGVPDEARALADDVCQVTDGSRVMADDTLVMPNVVLVPLCGLSVAMNDAGVLGAAVMPMSCNGERNTRGDAREENEQWQENVSATQEERSFGPGDAEKRGGAATGVDQPMSADREKDGLPQMGQVCGSFS